MNIIETRNLTRRYGRLEAVHDLDLTIPVGGVTALLGQNGAGKSTTLRLLVNLLRPTAGSAKVFGVDSRKLAPAQLRRLGYVAESQDMPKWMTVRQFIDYCRPFYPTWDRDLERTLLAQLDLPLDRRLGQLSRGMLMKASLLSSLVYRPELLVLDEPFGGLDPLVRDEFVRGLFEVTAPGGCTVLIASHDIEEVERFCDRVVLLDAGRKQIDEPVESLQARFRRIEVTFPDTVAAAKAASSASWPVGWREFSQSGLLARFVDTAYDPAVTVNACRRCFPNASITAYRMTLREVFVTLARLGRTKAERKAA